MSDLNLHPDEPLPVEAVELHATAPVAPAVEPHALAPARAAAPSSGEEGESFGQELVAWFKTVASAAVYATLLVTFGFQVARVDGQSMAPTLQDQDRLIVNKFVYRVSDPKVGDVVMLYYPVDPSKAFVKRVIAGEGDQVKITDGKVYR